MRPPRDSPSSMTHGAPTVAEQVRPKDLTPEPQQASPPVKLSPPFLPLQPTPPQDPQLGAQQTSLAWIPGMPPSHVSVMVRPTTNETWSKG